jgi:hypothetical protein
MERLKLEDIPCDLEDMIYDGEHILGNYSEKFDRVMIGMGLMEHGSSRRSHRIMTEKCQNLGYFGTVKLLTGLTETQVREIWAEETKENEIKKMFETAKEYGYIIREGV